MALLVVPHPSCCLVWFGWKSWKTSQEGEYAQKYPQRQSGEAFFWCVSSCFSRFPVKMDNLYPFVLSFFFLGVSPTLEVQTHPEMAVEVA